MNEADANDNLAAKRPRVSFEFFPAKTGDGETALRSTVKRLEALDPEFVGDLRSRWFHA